MRTFSLIYIFQHQRGPAAGMQRHSSIDDDAVIQIGPLKIEIVQGDLSKEYTTAIVNVTDKWFTQAGMQCNETWEYQ